MKADFLSGFVSIVGSPNVGKSTLMNALVGQKVAIVSPKAQTTRNTIRGVMSRPDFQIVFLDTPGIHTPNSRLGQYMVSCAYGALDEIECAVMVIDPTMGLKERDEGILERLKAIKAPVIIAISKADIVKTEKLEIVRQKLQGCDWARVIEISAVTGQGLEELTGLLKGTLVKGPQYFPEDMVTDQPERVICAEMVREAALTLLQEEVPHGIGVDIDKMTEREGITDVWATIYCDRASHKGIIIGKAGSMLKKIGIQARREMEWMLGVKVNLQLWVKIREDWRNKSGDLKMLGYTQKD